MEKHQLHGQVVTEIERPPAEIVAAFARHDTAKVGDSMGRHGIMEHRMKPIQAGMRVLGPAVTVLTRPGDALYVAHAADVAEPGDVIVVDAGGWPGVSVIGERIAYYMQEKRHIAGIVIDGGVRDVKGLRDLEFPTFAVGATPSIFGSQGPGAINVPIACGGVPVNPGDIVIGDDDGVVVVPRDDAERVLALADEHLAGELERLAMVDRGMRLTEVQGLESRLNEWIPA
jgi:regulator of RNase E activity RraA